MHRDHCTRPLLSSSSPSFPFRESRQHGARARGHTYRPSSVKLRYFGTIFKSALKTHLFSSGLWMPCVCACSCMPLVLVCWKWWERCWMKRCSVLVYAVSRVKCTQGCLYILLTLLFLHCAFWALVRCKRLTNTLLHYITHIRINACPNSHMHACPYAHTHTQVYVHVHMHIRIHTCMHVRMHTHMTMCTHTR